ncbi:MAG: carboxypeptidase regulatory-like domain-containing protein [Crocinitomicaceae bacterium]|nr:carboxypeptidase regulatory-like domain-containing protein [Crocinitomicaceae bacterium]
MKFQNLISIILIFAGLNSLGQTYVISGTVTDIDGDPIPGARCFVYSDKNEIVKTNASGKFYLNKKSISQDTLYVQHVAFETYKKIITYKTEKRLKRDTLFLDIVLSVRTFPDIVVYANTPDTVFGTQDYSVEDFEFDKHGNLVLLTYEKNIQSGCKLRLIGSGNEELDVFYIDGIASELRLDFRNNIHLVTDERIFLVTIVNQQFEIFLEDRDYFFRYVVPVLDTIGPNIYFSNYSEIFPAFDYYEFNRDDSVYTPMLKIEDSLMMELYRSEYKYVDARTKIWAHQKQIETGIDKEIWVGATVFTNSIYYTPLYAPLFRYGEDTILIFDHYTDQLFHYRPGIGKTDSVIINYHHDARKSGWEQPLIQDEVTGKVYAIFSRGGFTYLHEINAQDGSVKASFKLYFKYPERIKIRNGEVFYIYRPFESIQKKYIYREKLVSTT